MIRRPGTPIPDFHFMEIIAAQTETCNLDAAQVAGMLKTYKLDSSWVTPSMTNTMLVTALWTRADRERYLART